MTEREASILGRSIEAGFSEIARAIVEASAKQQRCLHRWSDMDPSNHQQTCRNCNEIRLIK